MIVVLKSNVDKEKQDRLVDWLKESGVDVSDLVPPSVIEAYKKSK